MMKEKSMYIWVDKIFAKNPKNLICGEPGSVTFLTLGCLTLWKKSEKTDNPEILLDRNL